MTKLKLTPEEFRKRNSEKSLKSYHKRKNEDPNFKERRRQRDRERYARLAGKKTDYSIISSNGKNNLKVSLGKDFRNRECFIDFANQNINLILLVGESGTGKSVLGYHIYQQLFKQNSPKEITFVLIDNVHLEFTQWDQQSPYLLCQNITNQEKAFEVLENIAHEVKLINTGTKHYFIHIEECDQFAKEPFRMKGILSSLIDSDANSNVHIVFSTSRPAPEIITDWLLELTDLKIIFQLASTYDYFTVSGEDLSNSISNEVGEKIVILQNQITYLLPLSVDEVISAENFKLS